MKLLNNSNFVNDGTLFYNTIGRIPPNDSQVLYWEIFQKIRYFCLDNLLFIKNNYMVDCNKFNKERFDKVYKSLDKKLEK